MLTFHLSKSKIATSRYEDGTFLLGLIKPELDAGREVEVNFEENHGFASSFLHGFMGNAFTIYGKEKFKQLVKLRHLTKQQGDFVRNYFRQTEE
jgi:hypothetical protein